VSKFLFARNTVFVIY